jgi:hypothetical protein
MIDKEIILAFINNQGTGFSWIVMGFFATVVALVLIKVVNNDAYNQDKNAARREGLENLRASIARLVHDQQEIKDRIAYRDTIVPGE